MLLPISFWVHSIVPYNGAMGGPLHGYVWYSKTPQPRMGLWCLRPYELCVCTEDVCVRQLVNNIRSSCSTVCELV